MTDSTFDCRCCTSITDYDDMDTSMVGYDTYYTPDNTCKFESYGAASSAILIIIIKIENDDILLSSHVNDLFDSIPTATCPFDDSEIEDIVYDW